jgi:hypothetical protein
MHWRANDALIRYYYAIKPDYWNGFTPGESRSFAKSKAISEIKSTINSDENICKFEYIKDLFTQLKDFGIINQAMAIPNN